MRNLSSDLIAKQGQLYEVLVWRTEFRQREHAEALSSMSRPPLGTNEDGQCDWGVGDETGRGRTYSVQLSQPARTSQGVWVSVEEMEKCWGVSTEI